jgi:hypothetical protein
MGGHFQAIFQAHDISDWGPDNAQRAGAIPANAELQELIRSFVWPDWR